MGAGVPAILKHEPFTLEYIVQNVLIPVPQTLWVISSKIKASRYDFGISPSCQVDKHYT